MDTMQNETVRSLRTRAIRPERDNEYWTVEERAKLENAFYEGAGLTEIALRHKRSELAVVQQIEKLDLYERKANPMRRKSAKSHCCLCSVCQAPEGLCPMVCNCKMSTEAIVNE